ncbi:MAG: class I SAM-dependent methyltransferase [Verrucomicrobiota bacterium]
MNLPAKDPLSRFSDRVENYIKYRPGYPPEILRLLEERCRLSRHTRVADIGSGTGILTEMFLRSGMAVDAVEPNIEMRKAAENLLGSLAGFASHDGCAEQTGLEAESVDLIVAAQAFHWFDRPRAKAEFRRILAPGGWVALIWNDRETATTPFLKRYEELLHGLRTDYPAINHMNISAEVLGEFFAPNRFETATFRNAQSFDFEGLRGRCLSSSYVPNVGQAGHDEMLAELKEIFDTHQVDGQVEFRYTTQVHLGNFC